jgi:hypothetical protein
MRRGRMDELDQYWGLVDSWYQTYLTWLVAGELVGSLLIVGSIAVAASPPILTRFIDVKNLAFLVAILAGVNNFLDPIGRAEGYGLATTNLQIALVAADAATKDSPE